MNRCGIVLALSLLAGIGSAVAQSQPDLSGKWELLHRDDIRGGEPLSAFGQIFIATQSPTGLSVDWHSTGRGGRGTSDRLVYRRVNSTFPFDGTESNVTTIASSGSVTRIVDTATWNDGRLVITRTWKGNGPAYISLKRRLSLRPDGTLIVETSTPPTQAGEDWFTVESRYRRVGRLLSQK